MLLSIAFIEAEHLLRVKYAPTRATVTSFLSGWLFGRMQSAPASSRAFSLTGLALREIIAPHGLG